MSQEAQARVAVVGGSGLYEIAGLEDVREVAVDTPFGAPSDTFLHGTIAGRPAIFLARHGRKHELMPGEVNYRANVYALKTLGVERILSASAVGSMREEIRPQDVVLVDRAVSTRNLGLHDPRPVARLEAHPRVHDPGEVPLGAPLAIQ